MTETRILEKVRRCMALAQDKRANPTEAATALRQAQALMQKYGIDELKLATAEVGSQLFRSKVSVKNPMPWEWSLINTVCGAFGCKPVWHAGGPEPTNKGYFSIIGRKQYLPIAEYTAEVLMRQATAARNAYVKTLDDYEYTRGDKSKMANAFCLAWVQTVSRLVSKFADPDGSVKKANALFIEQTMGTLQKAKQHKTHLNVDALIAGRMAAEGVQLNRPTGTDVGKTLLIGN